MSTLVIVSMLMVSATNVYATQSHTENFDKTYSLGENQAENLVNVAQKQIGKTKADLGYTEAWCADFVCDSAKLTGMSDSIIPYNYASRGGCRYLYNYMVNNCSAKAVNSRQRGDIIFYYCSSCGTYVHTGIVVDDTYSIEGNYGGKVTKVKNSYTDSAGHKLSSGTITRHYLRPNYKTNSEIIKNNPIGAVDKIEGNQGSISVYGWAYDLDDINASLEIHVYIGGEAGSGAECHVINAAEASPDLSPVVGNHRFASTIETSLEGNQPVYIYAINIGSGENILIGSGNAVITQKNITFEPSTTENVTSSNAIISAWGRNKGTMQELGFYFGMDGEYQNQSRIVVSKDVSWTDFCMKYDVNTYYGVLNPGQKYRYAFFCVKDGQEYKSDEAVFTTAGSAGISFDSLNAADVTSESATLHCWGSNSNGYTLSSIGFEIGTGYTSEDRKAYEVWKEQSWIRPELTVNISEYCGKLKPDTDYAVRFYANIGQTRYYSDYITFKTESDVITFDEVNISDVSNTNAVLSVWLNNSGTINEIGLYIGDCEQIQERITYTTKDVAWTRANIVMNLNKYWKTLQPGQTYTYVFYAKKGEQEYRSKPGQFTASGEKRISFEDINISEISMDGAKIGAWFSNPQGNTLTAIGMDIRDANYGEYTSFEVAHNVGWTRAYLEYDITDYCQILKPKTTYQLRYYIEMDGEKYYSAFSKFTTAEADPSIIQQGICGTNLKWTLNQEGVLKISGKGEMKNYTYRSEMPWYSYKNQIEKVKIESGVTSIGDYAFYGMPAMKEIVIPDGVKTIGAYAFKNCTVLKTAELPSTLKKLGESAFYGCSALEKMNIPEGIYTIWAYTFKNCTSLAEVILPSTLIKLDEASFYGCSSLEELQIPDQVSIIGIYTFKNCSKLRTVKLPTALTGVREAAFYGTALTDVTLPSKVQTIGSYAFKNCTSLKAVQMPDGLQKIDDSAFYGCTSLVALELPDNVTSINNYAFRRCTGLQKIRFSNGLKTIGECAFYGCTGLTELNLPDSVTEMGSYAFKTCTGVTSIHIPAGVETLKESVFYGCSSVTAMEIPSNVKRIENYVFASCSGLKEIRFTGNMPEIGAYAFARVNAQVQYPTDDATWSKDKMQNYGGQLNWMIPQDNDSKEDAVEVEVPEEQDEVLPDTGEKASAEENQTTGVEESSSQNEETQTQPEETLQEDDNESKEQNPETEEQEEENTEASEEENLETVEQTMEQNPVEQETVEK